MVSIQNAILLKLSLYPRLRTSARFGALPTGVVARTGGRLGSYRGSLDGRL